MNNEINELDKIISILEEKSFYFIKINNLRKNISEELFEKSLLKYSESGFAQVYDFIDDNYNLNDLKEILNILDLFKDINEYGLISGLSDIEEGEVYHIDNTSFYTTYFEDDYRYVFNVDSIKNKNDLLNNLGREIHSNDTGKTMTLTKSLF